jgi:hypothetical protein
LRDAGHISQEVRAGRPSLYTVHPRSNCGAQEVRAAPVTTTPAGVALHPAAAAGEPLLSITSPPPGSQRARHSAMPADWQPPSLIGLAGSIVAGWSSDRLELERDKFKAHHEAKGSTFVSWTAAWRNWVLNAASWERPAAKASSTIGWGPVGVGARANA